MMAFHAVCFCYAAATPLLAVPSCSLPSQELWAGPPNAGEAEHSLPRAPAVCASQLGPAQPGFPSPLPDLPCSDLAAGGSRASSGRALARAAVGSALLRLVQFQLLDTYRCFVAGCSPAERPREEDLSWRTLQARGRVWMTAF